jgi:hypothetical protein
MSVFKVGRRNGRWTYDFWLGGQRYQGYCVDPATNAEAKNRREATEIESTLRRSARQTNTLTRKGVRPGTYTLAMAAALHLQRKVGTDPDHIANHKLYVAEILDFFGPATAVGEITAAHVEEYRQRAATQKLRVWIGGPDPKKRLDRRDEKWWRTTKRTRSARTTNNYLMCLAALFTIAYNTRNTITRERELLFPLEVRLLKTPKREPRPMPDGEFDARQAVAPPWTAEAAELSRVFGLRRGEALWVERRHIDREEGGLLFSGEETKSGRDERVFGGAAGVELLERLRLQAVRRGQTHLVTWPGPKHWRPMLRGEEVPREAWRPLKSVRRSWRTTIKTGEIDQPHRFHDVRARYVTEVAKVQAAATQDAARHADPATTALYIKLAAGEVRAAVAKAIGRRPKRANLKVIG